MFYCILYYYLGGTYSRDNRFTNYIINTSTTVTLTGGLTPCIFTLVPSVNSELIITQFNTTNDKINLQHFKDIVSIHELNITTLLTHQPNNTMRTLRTTAFNTTNNTQNIIITLSNNQQRIILHNIVRNDLNNNNFIFDHSTSTTTGDIGNHKSHNERVILTIIGEAIAVVVALYLIYKIVLILQERNQQHINNNSQISWDTIKLTNPTYVSFINDDSDHSIQSDNNNDDSSSSNNSVLSEETKSDVFDSSLSLNLSSHVSDDDNNSCEIPSPANISIDSDHYSSSLSQTLHQLFNVSSQEYNEHENELQQQEDDQNYQIYDDVCFPQNYDDIYDHNNNAEYDQNNDYDSSQYDDDENNDNTTYNQNEYHQQNNNIGDLYCNKSYNNCNNNNDNNEEL
jgi:hypothetical protein